MRSFRWLCAMLLMTAIWVPMTQGAVVINELYYDAPSTDDNHEFIELYNNGAASVDLSGWVIEWAGTSFPTGSYAIPPGTTIQPADYLLIGGSLVQSDFGVIPDLITMFIFQNGGAESDGVRITNGSGYFDTILYDSPNTNLLPGDDANPGAELCPDVVSGHSLERVTVGVDNNLASDWVDRITPTPTRSSTLPGNNPPVLTQTTWYPNIVSRIDQVNVTSRAYDDYALVSINIRYQVNGGGYGRFTVPMLDDGLHGDGAAGDSVYGGYIPTYDPGTDIDLYVEATDDSGAVSTFPAGGSSDPISYTVYNLPLSTIASVKIIDANGSPILLDTLVMVKGLVEAANQFGTTGPAYIRDATGGIAVYGPSVTARGIAIGDSVRVMGWIFGYNGLIEISPSPGGGTTPPVFLILNRGNTVTPQVVTIPQVGESTEGLLLRINGGHFVQTGSFAIGNYDFVVGTDSLQVYIDNAVTTVIGTAIPAGTCDIAGCLGQYDTVLPLFEGYEILPRFIADVITIGNQPPAVGTTLRLPLFPTPSDTVWVTSRAYDDHGLASVTLYYQVNGGGWFRTQVIMLDDGLHHEGAAGDSVFGAWIPPRQLSDVVDFYVSALDDSSAITTDPIGAPGNHYTYTVSSGPHVTPISYVRANNVSGVPIRLDSLFVVRALVTCAGQLGTSGPAYVQDANGGVAFFDPTVASSGIAIGDSIELTSWVGFYNGLTEMVDEPVSGYDPIITILSSGNMVTPTPVTLPTFGESFEGRLVRVDGGQFVEAGSFVGSTTYHYVVGTDTLDIYIDSSTDIVGNVIPVGSIGVIGCAGQFDASSPYSEGYQLTPRMFSDFVTSALQPVDDLVIRISGSNVVLTWTDVVGAADYKVYYSSAATGPWVVLATSTSGNTTYTHVGGAAAPTSIRFYYVTAND